MLNFHDLIKGIDKIASTYALENRLNRITVLKSILVMLDSYISLEEFKDNGFTLKRGDRK